MKQLFLYTVLAAFFIITFSHSLYSQEDKVKWKRGEAEEQDLHLFHSTHAVNLPTAETLQKGNLEFEISHRFIPTIKSGSKDLYGFDGPVNMRIALGYGVTDKLFAALGRSNESDNVDLWLKYNAVQIPGKLLPFVIALRGGAAWNTDVSDRADGDSKNFQYYGQLIINTMLYKRLGIGIVPSYLDNSYILTNDRQYSFTLGTNLQYYFTPLFNVLFEWNPTVTGFRMRNNPVAFGIELETGGHFFKIILTNSIYMNPSQYLAGSLQSFNNGEWHIGFNITRLLRL